MMIQSVVPLSNIWATLCSKTWNENYLSDTDGLCVYQEYSMAERQ